MSSPLPSTVGVLKMLMSAILGGFVAAMGLAWSASAAWSQTTQQGIDNTTRIEKIETLEDQREKDYIGILQAIATLQAQMQNNIETTKEIGKDVKDIRTMVK